MFLLRFALSMNDLPVIRYPCLRKELWDWQGALIVPWLQKVLISPQNRFLDIETTICYTFPSDIWECLSPDDPTVLPHNMGIWLLATHSLRETLPQPSV